MKTLVAFLGASLVVGADRFLKTWVLAHLSLGESRPLIDGIVRITRVHNTGGALGIFPGGAPVFVAISIAVSAGLAIYLLVFRRDAWLLSGAALTLGGALGNLIDRLAYGYVLDFLELRSFSVLNLADACVTIGVALLLIRTLVGGDRHRSTRQADHV